MGDSQNPPPAADDAEIKAALERKRAARRAMAGGGALASSPTKPKTEPPVEKDVDASGAPRKYVPFYKRRVFQILAVLAVLGAASPFVVGAIVHYLHRDELAVRDEMASYAFDHQTSHFDAIDALGPAAVTRIVGYLDDPTEVENDNGHSTTKTEEVALDYMIHYAQKIGVAAPAVALDAQKKGSFRLKQNDWAPIKTAFEKWWADAQASGKALK